MIQEMKSHPASTSMGMIAAHLGIVRGSALDGRVVTEIDVSFDRAVVSQIINDINSMKGIIDVKVEYSEGRLKVGDDILAVVVSGDTREHVFPALMSAVNRLKKEASRKTEFF
jgi:molybdopterin synthase catalytic subunit